MMMLRAGVREAGASSGIRRGALGAVILLASSACGSSVEPVDETLVGGRTADQIGPGASEPGLAAAPGAVEGRADASLNAPSSSGESTMRRQPNSNAIGPGATSSTSQRRIQTRTATAAPPPGASGPGFTATEINVGIAYNSQMNNAAATAFNVTLGDPKKMTIAVVKDINKNGGIAGRKVVPVFFDTQEASGDWNAKAQAVCTRWTQDKRVFAAHTLISQLANDTYRACLGRNEIVNATSSRSRADFNRFGPYEFSSTGAVIERLAPVWAQRLNAQGYFESWKPRADIPEGTKVGLLYGFNGDWPAPARRDEGRALTQALARQGYPVAASFETNERTRMNQEAMRQVVLKFSQAGITHVVGDASLIEFAPAARAQNYFPRFGVATFSGPPLLKLVSGGGQLRGALGIGWVPIVDVDQAQDPPGDVSPRETHCREVMKEAGQPTDSRLAMATAYRICEVFNFLSSAVEAGDLSPAGVQRGIAAMGSMPPVSTFRIQFKGGRRDGLAAVRDLEYRLACECFAYASSKNHGV